MGKSKSSSARNSASMTALLLAAVVVSAGCNEHSRAGRSGSAGALGQAGTSSAMLLPSDTLSGGAAGSSGSSSGSGSEQDGVGLPIGRGEVRAGGREGTATRQGDAAASTSTIDGGRAVVLTAVVMSVSPGGAPGIGAEWANHTDESIFLQGCSTVEGWFLRDGQWERYGAFATCAAETPAVEVGPGETYLDVTGAAAAPPNRGSNVWRLVGKYGVGCQRGALLGASQCRELREVTSVNQIAWVP